MRDTFVHGGAETERYEWEGGGQAGGGQDTQDTAAGDVHLATQYITNATSGEGTEGCDARSSSAPVRCWPWFCCPSELLELQFATAAEQPQQQQQQQ